MLPSSNVGEDANSGSSTGSGSTRTRADRLHQAVGEDEQANDGRK
jgi:hypothetical protein